MLKDNQKQIQCRPVTGRQILLTLILWIISSAAFGAAFYYGFHKLIPNWNINGPIVVIVG